MAYRKLGRDSSARKALFRSILTSFFKYERIETTEAKAKEIAMVYDAIKSADPDEKLVQIKSLEALEEIAKGDANKVFIPFEATSALSSLGAMKEIVTDKKDTKK